MNGKGMNRITKIKFPRKFSTMERNLKNTNTADVKRTRLAVIDLIFDELSEGNRLVQSFLCRYEHCNEKIKYKETRTPQNTWLISDVKVTVIECLTNHWSV